MGAETEAKMAACKKICSPILAAICIVLEIIIFIFAVVGTPVDAFRQKTPNVGPGFGSQSGRWCYSLWGMKRCGAHKVQKKGPFGIDYPNGGFPSSKIHKTMQAAQAFAILSIVFSLITLILSGLLVCKCLFGFIPGIFGILTLIFLVIVVGCSVGAFHTKISDAGGKISNSYNLNASPALFIVAFVLQLIYVVIVFCV